MSDLRDQLEKSIADGRIRKCEDSKVRMSLARLLSNKEMCGWGRVSRKALGAVHKEG